MTLKEAKALSRVLRRARYQAVRVVRHAPHDPEYFVTWREGRFVHRVFWQRVAIEIIKNARAPCR